MSRVPTSTQTPSMISAGTMPAYDDRVTKHLMPHGVEYRDMRGVIVATLERRGGRWCITPRCPEYIDNHMQHLPATSSFDTQKAADAYAYVINLERQAT